MNVEIYNDIKGILISLIEDDQPVEPDSDLSSDLSMDSMLLSCFIIICEKKYNIKLDAAFDDTTFIPTVRNCVTYIDEELAKIY